VYYCPQLANYSLYQGKVTKSAPPILLPFTSFLEMSPTAGMKSGVCSSFSRFCLHSYPLSKDDTSPRVVYLQPHPNQYPDLSVDPDYTPPQKHSEANRPDGRCDHYGRPPPAKLLSRQPRKRGDLYGDFAVINLPVYYSPITSPFIHLSKSWGASPPESKAANRIGMRS